MFSPYQIGWAQIELQRGHITVSQRLLQRRYMVRQAHQHRVRFIFTLFHNRLHSCHQMSRRLIKELFIFSECGPFINPAYYPPPRLFASRTASSNALSFNLSHKQVGMGVASFIMYGTVVDSHLVWPRIPKATGVHSITMWPFKGTWFRALAAMAESLNETSFLHYVIDNGITFQGTWGTPSECFACVRMSTLR